MNVSPNKYKIALVGYMLSNGGAERVLSTLSQYLHNNHHDVHTIIMIDEVTYSYGGELFNVGALRNKSNNFLNKIRRFYKFKKYIENNEFDILIDFRFRVVYFQEFFIYKFIYKTPRIQTVHSGSYHSYLFKYKFLSNYFFKKFDKIVTVSKRLEKKINSDLNFTNVQTIYNPIDIDFIKEKCFSEKIETYDFDYIVAVGRLADTKQFDKLIEAYCLSVLPIKNIHLVIVGSGPELERLQNLVNKKSVSELIHFMGQIAYPYKIVKHAKFLVQSSLFEGFPMVILESLCCETPVIAFDCFSGPDEIIVNGENGILVENQNFNELVKAINKMEDENDFYLHCKKNAFESIKKFDISKIGPQWEFLIARIKEHAK